MDEASLVARWQAGDVTAFAELYQRYKTPALRAAYLITGSQCDSENVLQDTFLKCYQTIGSLRDVRAFRRWFYRILTRTAWDCCKKREHELPVADVFDAYQAKEPKTCSTLELVTEREQEAELLAAIDRLPLKQRTVVILYYYNELSVSEIAAATGTLAGTVKSRLFMARQNLRDYLGEAAKGEGLHELSTFSKRA